MTTTEKAIELFDQAGTLDELDRVWIDLTNEDLDLDDPDVESAKDWRVLNEIHARRMCSLRLAEAIGILGMQGIIVHWSDVHRALAMEGCQTEVNPADQISPSNPVVDGFFGPNGLRIVKTEPI